MSHLKATFTVILAAFLVLFIVSTFVPPPATEVDHARLYFTEEQIETGLRFAFERRFFFWGSTALELGLLLALVGTGWLGKLCARWTGYSDDDAAVGASLTERLWSSRSSLARWLVTLLLVGAGYAILYELLQFPLAVGRFYHSRAWGMTERPFADWLGQYVPASGVTIAGEAIPGVGLYLLLRWFPRTWYLWAGAGGICMAFAFAWLMPVVVAPLFNTFTPLAETRWADLESPVRKLAGEAGIPVDGIYVVDASRQGNHTNAYFSGMGSTQSIVLYDTLLKQHPRNEVESILAHEIGHWTHHHIIKGILLASLAAFAGLLVLDWILRRSLHRPPLNMRSISDPAGLPLVLLLGFLGTWIALPLQNAVSRYFERQADATSLQLAGMPEVFIAAEQRLSVDNKSNVVAAPWNVWLFSTHPTTLERIEMARQWERRDSP
jgi:STE24 endopeptidase